MINSSVALKVLTLGQFSLIRNEEVVSGGNWKHRRVRELFKVLLAAEQHRLHREQVQELLWPSSSLEQAANSFGKTLYLLRRVLEPDLVTGKASAYVCLDQDTLFLAPDSMYIDADYFEAMAKNIQAMMHTTQTAVYDVRVKLEALDGTLELYSGDFLPDDLYEDWTQRRRDRLRYMYSQILQHAVTAAIAAKQGQRACEYLRTLLDQNGTDEETHRQLMLTYARMGRRSDALNQYQMLRAALREELHANPLPETQELYRAIQAGHIQVDFTETPSTVVVRSDSPIHVPVSVPASHIHTHAISDKHGHEALTTRSITNTSTVRRSEVTETVQEYLKSQEASRTEMVGREDELQRLQEAYHVIWGRERERERELLHHIFFISGEAGIGKTRLAREFHLYAQEQQATILWGNCYELSGMLPYQPIVDMLNTHLLPRNAEQLRPLLGNHAVDLAKLLPIVHSKFPDLSPSEVLGLEVERRNLYNAVASYFNAIASTSPLVLIFDDLQWADSATMQLLCYLLIQSANLASLGNATPFFLLLYRPDEVSETHPLRNLLLAQFHRGYAQEIQLRRLKEEEVQQLLMQMAGHTVSTPFTEEIYKYTEGNPFFIGETIRALIEGGEIKKTGERWQTTVALEELALPQSVRLVIERRLVNLSSDCRMTLVYASFLGRQIHSELLRRVRNLSEEAIAEHLDDAIRAHILEPLKGNIHSSKHEYEVNQTTDLMFTHDKIRAVLVRSLNPLRHRITHRQIAQTIEEYHASHLPVYYRKLAYHYHIAEDVERAVDYLHKAATQAIQVYAFTDAAELMEQAVELLLGAEYRAQRAELLHKLSAEVYIYIGRPDKAIEAGLAAATLFQELGDPIKEAESRLDVAFSFHWTGHETKAISAIKRALLCLEQAPHETLLMAKAHVQWGMAATISGNIPEALEHLSLTEELHERIGATDTFIVVVSLWTRSWCAFASGTLQQMLDAAQQSAALCRTMRMFAWEPMMTYTVAWALMLMGRLEEGASLAYETLENAQRHNAVGAQGWAYLVLSFLAIQQGQWDLVDQFGDQAAEIAMQMHEMGLLARVFWGRSICSGWHGEWEKALEYALEGVRLSRQDDEVSLIYPYLLSQVAKASFYVGKKEDAQFALNQAMQFAQKHHYRQLPALCYRLQGRILQAQGAFEQAQDSFEQSLAELAALNDAVEYARTQEAYALFFFTRNRANDTERATALQQQAHATFKRLGVNG
ncbi:MAG: hypothetical protein NVS4B1_29820 [Ktedonobacteraceae bacterium]